MMTMGLIERQDIKLLPSLPVNPANIKPLDELAGIDLAPVRAFIEKHGPIVCAIEWALMDVILFCLPHHILPYARGLGVWSVPLAGPKDESIEWTVVMGDVPIFATATRLYQLVVNANADSSWFLKEPKESKP